MSVIINPIITNAGLNVFTPMATGIEFTFTHVAVGTGTSAVNANATALENEIARFPIAGGGVIAGGKAVSINALVTNHSNANPQDYNISEVGFYGLDANNNTILFAIHRQNTTIVRKVAGADIALPFVLGLSALPVENMTVTIDTNTSGALALLGQHVAANHPHTQYKRILDNTERLKIATAVEADEAIRKDELDALRLRLIANGIDADLSSTNHLPNINVDAFLMPEGYFDEDTLGDKPFTYGLCKTWKENNTVVYQYAQSFTNGDFATRMYRSSLGYWTDWKYYANISGSSTQTFSVATATANDHAVSKSQLDGAISTLTSSIMNKAWPIGSVYENRFDTRNPSHQDLLGFGTWVTLGEGRVTVGYQSGDPDFGTIGQTGGEKGHKMTLDNLIEHDHEYLYWFPSGNDMDGMSNDSTTDTSESRKTTKTGNADPTPIPTLPPYIVVIRWVRTA